MAKPGRKPKVKEEALIAEALPELTIKSLPELKKQWEANKLDPRTKVALKAKLIELKKADKIHELEEEMLWKILQRDRINDELIGAEEFLLNEWEASTCEQSCIVKMDGIPSVHGLVKDAKMKFWYDGDNNRYHVYPIRIIPPEHQLDIQTAKRIAAGITVDPATFPPAKTQVRHLNLNANEFNRWFDALEGDGLTPADKQLEGILEL